MNATVGADHLQAASMFLCWPTNAADLCKQDSDLPNAVAALAQFIANRERLATREIVRALERADRLCKEALPKFNWGASALDANAIALLNEVPIEIRAALPATRTARSFSPSGT